MAGAPGPGGGLCTPSGGQTTLGGHTGAALAAPIFNSAPVAKKALTAIAKSMGFLVIGISLGYEVSFNCLYNAERHTRFHARAQIRPFSVRVVFSLTILGRPLWIDCQLCMRDYPTSASIGQNT